MNPYDLRGPEFLVLYGAVALTALLLGFWLRRRLCVPEANGDKTPPLDPYEVAYLAGGSTLAVNAAVARLVQEGALETDLANRKVRFAAPLPAGAHRLEKMIHGDSADPMGATLQDLRDRTIYETGKIAQQLQDEGLLVATEQGWKARLLPLTPMLAVLVFGLGKLIVGVERHRPVVFLILSLAATLVFSLIAFLRPVLRSRRGDEVLARLKRENTALETTARKQPEAVPASDLPLMVALFGLGAVSTGRLAPLKQMLTPPAGAGGCGGDGGGGCGGGGCGGGGCGGCGG